MRLRSILLLSALLANLAPGARCAEASAHHWKLKDGENSRVIADSLNRLDGTIAAPERVQWAREDDRDWFLSFTDGGHAVIPDDRSLDYPEGFIATVRFSCDLEAIGKSGFAGLLCKGRNYKEAYSIMIQKRGRVLVYLNGMTPNYIQSSGKPVQSKRDCELVLAVGGGRMVLLVNGAAVQNIAVQGTLKPSRRPLTLGRAGNYLFSGNIYDVKLEPYDAARVEALLKKAAEPQDKARKTEPRPAAFPPLELADPAGTVTVSDFAKWTPAPEAADSGSLAETWILRPRPLVKRGFATLMVPFSVTAPVLEFDPGLKGVYDCYIGMRAVENDTALAFALGDVWYKLELPGAGRAAPHYPAEQPAARGVSMDGKKIRLASAGTPFFLGYLKFIPAGTPRAADYPALPGFRVLTDVGQPTTDDIDAQNAVVIRKQIADGYFRERVWQSDRPEPTPSEASRRRGFMVWNPDSMTMVFPESRPDADREIAELKTVLAAGETGDIAVAVRALTRQKALTCTVSPLKDAAGKPCGSITVTPALVMHSVKRTTNFRGKSEFMRLPGYLAENAGAELRPLESREFFLTVRVPAGTPGGLYRAKCTLRNAEGGTLELPLAVEVRDYELPKAHGVDLGFWCRNEKDADRLAATLNDFGMTSSVFNTFAFTGSTADDLHWDFGHMPLAAVAEAFKKYGMTGRMHVLTPPLLRRVETLPGNRRRETYVRMIRELEAYAKVHHWPPLVYHSFDEVFSQPEKLPAFLRELEYLAEAGVTIAADHIWYKTSRPYQKEADIAAPLIKVYVNRCNNRNLWYVDDFPTMVKTARKLGKEVIAYNSHNAVTATQPSAMRFCTGWFFRTIGRGASGQLFWTWSRYSNNPADDLDGTDTVYVIPPYGKQPGGPTLELVYLREGVTDLRYIQLLEAEIEAARKRGVDTGEEEKLLRSLAESFDMEEFRKKSVFFNSFWEKAWEKDGKLYASGDYLLPVGWKIADYRRARNRIAEAVNRLRHKK